nr:SPRY domain containing SOCS box protein 3 [Hymenolepis microstoma]
MIGVGEKDLSLEKSRCKYTSYLGADDHSCGHSYLGGIQYKGTFDYNHVKEFSNGSVVGCLLDMFYRKLYFFVDRELSGCPISLKGNAYYPMACSTAARTGVQLITTRSFEVKLQHLMILQNNLPREDEHHKFSSLLKILFEDCWPLRLPHLRRIPVD